MKTDFDIQWTRYKAWRRRCPLDDAELERRVELAQQGMKSSFTSHLSIRLWAPAAVAACLLAVLLPLELQAQPKKNIQRVNVEGCEFYFVCNHDCSPYDTLEALISIHQ